MDNALKEIESRNEERFKIKKKYKRRFKFFLEREIAIQDKQRRFDILLQESLEKTKAKEEKKILKTINPENFPKV